MEKYKLTMHREAGFIGLAIPVTIIINDVITAKAPVGTKSTFEVDYKPTKIRFTYRSLGFTTLDQTIFVDPSGFKDLVVRFRWTAKGYFSWKPVTQTEGIKYEVIYGERRPNQEAEVGNDSPSTLLEPSFSTEKNFCPQCGQKVDAGNHFCSNCGAKLD